MTYHLRLLAIVLFFGIVSCKKNSDKDPEPEPEPGPPIDIRVAGYLYSDNFWKDNLHTDLSLLTDLNLAFINPDEEGNFSINSNVADLISQAHTKNVRVYASVGGAGAPPHMKELVKPAKRSALVTNIINLVDQYNFDGVDVDLEGDFITEDYAGFISELSAALKADDKLMTAALATWNGDVIHDSTLAKYDFINVMSYDATGPWDPSNPGPHSPYEMAVADANYYIQSRHIDPKKILVGLPFYGYRFAAGSAESVLYKDIVSAYPGAEDKDIVDASGGGKIYYNGIPTIQKKAKLAAELNAAGVMIWEINQDAPGDKSLLKAINDLR